MADAPPSLMTRVATDLLREAGPHFHGGGGQGLVWASPHAQAVAAGHGLDVPTVLRLLCAYRLGLAIVRELGPVLALDVDASLVGLWRANHREDVARARAAAARPPPVEERPFWEDPALFWAGCDALALD